MATRRLFSYLAAGMLLFGAGTGSADLVDIIEVGRTGSGAAGGTATFKVYLNSGTADVGGGQLYYNFDDFAQWDQGSSSLTGFHTSFPGFWSPANGFPGSQADLQIAGAQFSMPPVPINQIWAEFTVAWLPGTTSLNLLRSDLWTPPGPPTQIIDEISTPIPGTIPAIIPIVPGAAPELGTVLWHQKISDTQGGFTGVLDDEDYFGWSVAALGDIDGDGAGDLAVGACQDDDGGNNQGAVWLLSLDPNGMVKAEQKISNTEGGFTGVLHQGDGFGSSVAALGDLDGAGVGDLAVAAPWDDDGGTDYGAVWLLFLDPNGMVKTDQKISAIEGGFGGVLGDTDYFGSSIAAIGDLNGDGVGDLAVGARSDDDGGVDRGAVWVLFLDLNGTVKIEQKISDTEGAFTGSLSDYDSFGSSLAAPGDLDGDGVGDLVVGADKDDDGGANRGAIWVLFLDPNGTVQDHQKISTIEGGFTGVLGDEDRFGRSVAAVGDLNGDGVGDLVVGAGKDDDGGVDRGAVWLLFLDPNGTVQDHQKISDTEGVFTGVLDDEDSLGQSVTALGDLDGDGVGDLAVGAYRDDDGGTNRGAVWVMSLDGVPIVCGDGVLDPLEECDDGNSSDDDGCSADCRVEVCGDINIDGAVTAADAVTFREFLADPVGNALWVAGERRCTVIGSPAVCDVLDVVVIRRGLAVLPPGIDQVCEAMTGG